MDTQTEGLDLVIPFTYYDHFWEIISILFSNFWHGNHHIHPSFKNPPFFLRFVTCSEIWSLFLADDLLYSRGVPNGVFLTWNKIILFQWVSGVIFIPKSGVFGPLLLTGPPRVGRSVWRKPPLFRAVQSMGYAWWYGYSIHDDGSGHASKKTRTYPWNIPQTLK